MPVNLSLAPLTLHPENDLPSPSVLWKEVRMQVEAGVWVPAQLSHTSAVWSWARHFPSLGLGFPVLKIVLIISAQSLSLPRQLQVSKETITVAELRKLDRSAQGPGWFLNEQADLERDFSASSTDRWVKLVPSLTAELAQVFSTGLLTASLD